MRAKEFLTELFQSHSGYEINSVPYGDTVQNGQLKYVFVTDPDDKNEYGRQGEVVIKQIKDANVDLIFVEFNIEGSTDTSGLGDQFKILGAVVKAVNRYCRIYKPKYIVFETEDPKKLGMYKSMVRRQVFPGYQTIVQSLDDYNKLIATDKELTKQIGPRLAGFADEMVMLQRTEGADNIKPPEVKGQYVIYGLNKYRGKVFHRLDAPSDGKALQFAREWIEQNSARLGERWGLDRGRHWDLAKDPHGEFAPAPEGQYSVVGQN
jgi:hypothetical protein